MKVVIINKSDSTGGAAVVSRRLMEALRAEGVDARMLVAEKLTDSPYVEPAASPARMKIPFITERLGIFIDNGFNRADLFKVDSGADGLPLWRDPLVKDADVVCLNWVNQGFLSLRGVRNILGLGKPVIWTMHDMWNFTGICHHAGSCARWRGKCGECPFLGRRASTHDLSARTWQAKNRTYGPVRKTTQGIHFVAVSNWLANLARESQLFTGTGLSVIPNAFPISEEPIIHTKADKFRIIMGAARLDDPIKGLPILVETTRQLKADYPRIADGMELITFGNIRNPQALDGVAIAHSHLGPLKGEESVRAAYASADAVVSTSLFETLPGTLVEGLAYGCIPVAFNRGGQPDIIDHLDTGYLATWDDDLPKAAANMAEGLAWAYEQDLAAIRSRMFDSARRKFDARVTALKYIELFNTLIRQF